MNNNYNNYYYPYNNMMRGIPNNYMRSTPNIYQNIPTRSAGGLLGRLFPSLSGASSIVGSAGATSGITFSGLLSGASKTLGVINQAIPVFYQIKPIWNNAKTVFKVAKAMRESDTTTPNNTSVNTNLSKQSSTNTNEPTFFN